MKTTIPYLVIFCLLTVSALARSANQAAHTHGMATLTLAQENDKLEIYFESPAANVIGFEHKAVSQEQKQAVKKTEAMLKSATSLFSFMGTSCQLRAIDLDLSAIIDDEHKQHEDHSHSKHTDKENHSEIQSHYHFICQSGQNLQSVSIGLFSQFSGIEKINAMWVTNTQQGSQLLTPNKNIIRLR